jgi:hypothetical protein
MFDVLAASALLPGTFRPQSSSSFPQGTFRKMGMPMPHDFNTFDEEVAKQFGGIGEMSHVTRERSKNRGMIYTGGFLPQINHQPGSMTQSHN